MTARGSKPVVSALRHSAQEDRKAFFPYASADWEEEDLPRNGGPPWIRTRNPPVMSRVL